MINNFLRKNIQNFNDLHSQAHIIFKLSILSNYIEQFSGIITLVLFLFIIKDGRQKFIISISLFLNKLANSLNIELLEL